MTEVSIPIRQGAGIDVCVCSYRRPEIVQTLAALSRQTVNQAHSFRVVVADNTREGVSREPVMRAQEALRLNLEYVHAPADNISIARNACLETARGEWIAFVDDDELPTDNWLSALIEEALRNAWDAVLGPVIAVYDAGAPGWLRRGDFHSTTPVWRHGAIATGYTGNVLFRRDFAERQALRFRSDLGLCGGEDDDFFYRFRDAGGRIGYAPLALCYERVDGARANLGWLMRRRFRAGQSHALRLKQSGKALLPTFLALAKTGYCAVAAVSHLRDSMRRNRYLTRAIFHGGVVGGLLGKDRARIVPA